MAEPDHTAVGTAQFPKEWKVVTLGEVAEIVGGSTPSTVKQEYWNGDIPFVSPTDVTNLAGRNFLNSTEKRITKNGLMSISANVVPPGAVLVTSRASIGFVAINQMPVVTNQGFANLICKGDVHNIYVLYLIRFLRHELERLASGSTFREVSRKSLRKLSVPLPPLSEQEKMASILLSVDDAIAKTDEVTAKTQQLKKGLMQQLLTRGIGHTKFKQTEIGEIPGDWSLRELGEASDEIYRYPTYYNIEYVDEGVPEVRGELIRDDGSLEQDMTKYRFITKETCSRYPRTVLCEGDFVLSVRGTMGKVAIIPRSLDGANMTANLIRISTKRNLLYPRFAKHLFLSDHFQRELNILSPQTTIKTITAPSLKSMKLPLPSLPEQHRIADMLDAVDDKATMERVQAQRLRKLKTGLMQVLLTGKVRVKVD